MTLFHPPNELLDEILAISNITAFNIVVSLLFECTKKLETPKEVVSLLEVWFHSYDLVNKIFNANNSILAQNLQHRCISMKKEVERLRYRLFKDLDVFEFSCTVKSLYNIYYSGPSSF